MTLLDLARKFDSLDPTSEAEARISIAEEIKTLLGEEHGTFEALHDGLVASVDATPAAKALIIQACARSAHEANLAYCAALGDVSQLPWEVAAEWQRDSAIKGVTGALAGNTPDQQHASWLADKEAAGWKYGLIKDASKKEHPCMVPYAELPEAQRRKDALYLAVVRAMHAALTNGTPSRAA